MEVIPGGQPDAAGRKLSIETPDLNRFELKDNPMCPCEEEEQTVDHLIYV